MDISKKQLTKKYQYDFLQQVHSFEFFDEGEIQPLDTIWIFRSKCGSLQSSGLDLLSIVNPMLSNFQMVIQVIPLQFFLIVSLSHRGTALFSSPIQFALVTTNIFASFCSNSLPLAYTNGYKFGELDGDKLALMAITEVECQEVVEMLFIAI